MCSFLYWLLAHGNITAPKFKSDKKAKKGMAVYDTIERDLG